MTPRIAIIIERADIALGGAERSMFEVVSALSQTGVQVHLLAAKGTATSDNVKILCPENTAKRVSEAHFIRALKRHLAREHYDIVHSVLPFDFADVYQPRGGTYAESLIRNATSYPIAWMRLFKRATAFANVRRTKLLQAERRLCRGTDGPVVAALSQYVVAQLREHYGTDPSRIVLIPNGVATGKPVDCEAAGRLRNQILDQMHLRDAEQSLLLLFVAHNFRLKGLDPLIRALHIALQRPSPCPMGLAIVGAGRPSRYRRLAQRLGVERQVIFLGTIQDTQNILSACDVGVLPTYYDPASRFILEVLAAGKPVITTRYNGVTDQFVHGRHGWVVDSPDNTQALADALLHFSELPNVAKASQAIAEDRLADRLSTRRVAADLLKLYNSILEKKGTQ
jgi:UDP-glucose:(heptosyl)LPS alpha-1,3-glucosyltransferase